MNFVKTLSPGWELGFWGSRKREGVGSSRGLKGAGSGSFLQEAVSGVLIAMALQFTKLLLLQGQHGVHLQSGQGRDSGAQGPDHRSYSPSMPNL